ncbi:hypothetical protein BDW75DRAFT_243424 [Aspergillus navahoensis]
MTPPVPRSLGMKTAAEEDIIHFQLMCQQALIRSEPFQGLYSAKALTQPLRKTHAKVLSLNTKLAAWKKNNPFHQASSASGEEDILIIFQRLSYYNSLVLVNQRCCMDQGTSDSSSLRIAFTMQVCADGSSGSIELLDVASKQTKEYIGVLVDYILLAARTLCTIAVQSCGDDVTTLDTQSLQDAYRRIRDLSRYPPGGSPDLHGSLTLLLLEFLSKNLCGKQ